jgi:hypothetical protein
MVFEICGYFRNISKPRLRVLYYDVMWFSFRLSRKVNVGWEPLNMEIIGPAAYVFLYSVILPAGRVFNGSPGPLTMDMAQI